MERRERGGSRRGAPRWGGSVRGAGTLLTCFAWATAFGCGDCLEDPWTVGVDQTLWVETVGDPAVAHLRVDVEVTPLLSELGETRLLLWLGAGAVIGGGELIVRYQDPSLPTDGGIAFPHEAPWGWSGRWEGEYAVLVPVRCSEAPCEASVALEVETMQPASFDLETRVEVVGPTDGEPAPGEVRAVWTVLP